MSGNYDLGILKAIKLLITLSHDTPYMAVQCRYLCQWPLIICHNKQCV